MKQPESDRRLNLRVIVLWGIGVLSSQREEGPRGAGGITVRFTAEVSYKPQVECEETGKIREGRVYRGEAAARIPEAEGQPAESERCKDTEAPLDGERGTRLQVALNTR